MSLSIHDYNTLFCREKGNSKVQFSLHDTLREALIFLSRKSSLGMSYLQLYQLYEVEAFSLTVLGLVQIDYTYTRAKHRSQVQQKKFLCGKYPPSSGKHFQCILQLQFQSKKKKASSVILKDQKTSYKIDYILTLSILYIENIRVSWMLQRLFLTAHAMLDQCVVLSRNMIFVLNLWSGPGSRGTSTQLLEPVNLCLPVSLFLSSIIPKILYDLLGGEIRLKEMQLHSLQNRIIFCNYNSSLFLFKYSHR